MATSFVGEIRMFGGNFAPTGWALCDGQLLAVSGNDTLFSLFGTFYGGDGRTTFGLPDLRGRIPIHMGQGPGLTNRDLGQKSGTETVTLTQGNAPSHTHPLTGTTTTADTGDPENALPALAGQATYSASGTPVEMSPQAITNTSVTGGQSHTNLQPFQCVNFIVSLFGIFPSRQ